MNGQSFTLNLSSNFKRSVKLDLRINQIRTNDEQVFKQFLDTNQRNKIQINKYFDPNYTYYSVKSNQWIQTNKNYKNK